MATDALQEWIDDKPPAVGAFASVVALGAAACHDLVALVRESSRSWTPYRKHREAWLNFYSGDQRLCGGVLDALGCEPDLKDGLLSTHQNLIWCRTEGGREGLRTALQEVTPDAWNLLRRRVRRYRVFVQSYMKSKFLADLHLPDEGDGAEAYWLSFWRSPAGQFFSRVAMPCFIHHGRWPSTALREATNPKRPNLRLLSSLVSMDRHVLDTPQVERLLARKCAARQGRLERIGKAIAAKTKRVSLKTVKYRLGRVIIDFAAWFDVRLDASDVRKLFDAVAQREHGKLADFDLAASPESLGKALWRERDFGYLPKGPDTKTLEHVRRLNHWAS